MTASTEPRGGLDLGWTPGEDGWGPAMNANLLRISRLGFHASVLSMTTTAPPGSPTNGAGYIIPAGASGAWAGRAGQVAVWDGSAWAYAVPRDGWTVHVVGVGLATYEDGAWSQANAVKPAEIGAEPYAGVPAQTSFWRSTAAGVRAWVQLVAADITDLATTLAAYLTKSNPTFTGSLTGPTAAFADLITTGNPIFGDGSASKSVNVNGAGGGSAVASVNLQNAGVNRASMQVFAGTAWRVVARDAGGVEIDSPFYVDLASNGDVTIGGTARTTNLKGALQVRATTVIDSSRNITGTKVKGLNAAGIGIRPVVALADGTFDDQDAATFRGTIGALAAALKGAANGVAELGADGRVPSGQLPSYVDDVLEYATFSAFPATGETGKIYVNLDQNKTWRWSGSAYVEISASLALGETSATAYRGDRGKIAYDHSQATGNPHGTTAADVGAMAAANPVFTGTLKQGEVARINPSGGANFSSLVAGNTEIFVLTVSNAAMFETLADSGDVFVAATNDGVIYSRTPSQARALMGAAKAPSKIDVSASATIGSIDASAIKITTTDVILTLSGGVDGQGWDIINPTASTGIAIPSGATLWKSIGSDVGPTTIALGGGRPIRITRIDANTWIMLGSQ